MLFCVFFFKQKTAYEMRISDWSSDVCSSDLSWSAKACPAKRIGSASAAIAHVGQLFISVELADHVEVADQLLADFVVHFHVPAGSVIDRNSVVEGKRVSVRLELGGSRFIK